MPGLDFLDSWPQLFFYTRGWLRWGLLKENKYLKDQIKFEHKLNDTIIKSGKDMFKEQKNAHGVLLQQMKQQNAKEMKTLKEEIKNLDEEVGTICTQSFCSNRREKQHIYLTHATCTTSGRATTRC